ncbi:cyclic nucleotide-gated ion channel 4-like isoform X2 [Panicum miliaceum]|uniref:Cyclic nucleotide-gated ion channel 4-like isoform X2 n=1 Tax=Panicum miliaceum TaxID=4540 RepID=A0A3L6SS90_PANMI|nr:cyclic nucleotide-gated ion channel 4-like isoform X2 [Panicum miliaceum]
MLAELSARPAASAPSPHGAARRAAAGEGDEKPTSRGAGGVWAAALDPRARWAREWDRAYLLACAAGLVVDPLFLYAVCLSAPLMCVFLDGWFAAAVTALRCAPDAMHAWNLMLRLRDARAPPAREDADEEAARPGRDDDARGGGAVPERRAARSRNKKGIFLDVFVILPVMQVIVWAAAPAMIRGGSTTAVMTVLLVAFLFEYLPKIYHSVRVLRRSQDASGYVFGTIWWGIALNLMAYFVAAHAVGACWYLLGAQRATKCLREQCAQAGSGCAPWALACAEPLYYGAAAAPPGAGRLAWAGNATARGTCLDSGDNYQYGAYKWTVMLVANPSRVERILLPIFWGLMTLSTFGNLESTTEWLEIVFNIITITGGLILVTMLIGNIKVPLFQHMDDLVLENICDRVKSLIFPKGEVIVREGDPMRRMLFIVRGHLQSSQALRTGATSRCTLGPGNFSGDELLSWCLRRPFLEQLPASSSTLATLESTEAFGLDAADVRYVTRHFRYTFTNDRVRRSARYYSPGWRTWAAVAVQLAWRRYKHRKTLASLSFIRPRRPLSRCSSLGEEKLRLYTALLTSPKPNQDDLL